MSHDRAALVAPDVLAAKCQPRQTLHCQCCGASYERGSFRCCAPPSGMASHVWLARACKPVKQGGCGKCYAHCTCPDKASRVQRDQPIDRLAASLLDRLKGSRCTS